MTEEIKNDILTTETPETSEVTPAPKKKSKKKLWIGLGIGIAGAGVLSVLTTIAIVVVLVLIFAFNTPKSVARDYMEGILEADASYFYDAMPDSVKEHEFDSSRDEQESIDELNKYINSYYDTLDKFYDEWEITYDIVDVYSVNKGYLEEIQEYYSDEYDCKVKAAKEIEISATLTADDHESSYEFTITVIRIGTKWYLEGTESESPLNILNSLLYSLYI